MNCSQCGAVVEEGLKFCKKCGARITTAEDHSNREQQERLEKQDELKKQEGIEEQEGMQLLARPTRLQHPSQGEVKDQGIQMLVKPEISDRTKAKTAEARAEVAATINLQNSQAQTLLEEIQNKSGAQAQNKTQDKMQNKIQDRSQKDSQKAANSQARSQIKTFMAKNKAKIDEGKALKTAGNKNMETNELKLFFNFMKDFIKHPLMEKAEIDERLENKNTFIYLGILLALNTFLSVILMEFVLKGLKDLIDVVAYLMSNLNADIHYLTGKIGLSFIMGSLIMNIGHIVIFAVLMSFIGSRIMKQNIQGQEVCKYMVAPLGVLVIGKLPVIFVTILNVKLGVVLYVLLVGLMMSVSMIVMQKRYGRNGVGIYSISGLYLLSMSINIFAGIKIMMMF